MRSTFAYGGVTHLAGTFRLRLPCIVPSSTVALRTRATIELVEVLALAVPIGTRTVKPEGRHFRDRYDTANVGARTVVTLQPFEDILAFLQGSLVQYAVNPRLWRVNDNRVHCGFFPFLWGLVQDEATR